MRYKSFIPIGIIPDGVKTNNMKKKKTAVQWLVEQMLNKGYFDCNKPLTFTNLDHLQHQALQMEREQIIDAFGIGCQVESTRLIGYHDMANQHYNETYGGEDE